MTDADEPANLRMTLTRQGGVAADVARAVWGSRWGRRGLIAFGFLMLAYVAFWFAFARDLPDATALLKYEPPLPTNIRSVDGTPV